MRCMNLLTCTNTHFYDLVGHALSVRSSLRSIQFEVLLTQSFTDYYASFSLVIILNGKEAISDAFLRNSEAFADRYEFWLEKNVFNLNLRGTCIMISDRKNSLLKIVSYFQNRKQ